MQQQANTLQYDVAIIGAGPAGCACALALKDAGLKVALIDKHNFPRDKVCGDAIPGRAIKVLRAMDPAFEKAFLQFPGKTETKKTTLYYNGKEITFSWVKPSYTCTRMDFDNFLFSLVKENTKTDIYTDAQPGKIETRSENILIPIKGTDKVIAAKMLIGADGAHSTVAKQLAHKTLHRNHHAGAIRVYYKNIAGCDEHTMQVYFDKQFLPSYLWIFPLPGNMANAGFGMLSSEIVKRKINIKDTFYEFIDRVPELKQKFKDATPAGGMDGFGLPLGYKIAAISGQRFMLAGDAASLVDPISGEGIGNAMLSGKLAADQVMQCFKQQDFSAAFIKQYDTAVTRALETELTTRYHAQRLLSKYPFLLDLVFLAGKVSVFRKWIQNRL